jgi:hypothetical protein
MALLTAAQMRDEYVFATDFDDVWLDTRIARAQGRANRVCNRTIEEADLDERYNIGDSRSAPYVVRLRSAPVTAVTKIEANAHTATPLELVETTDWVLDYEHGILTLGYAPIAAPQALRVQYTAGWTAETCPGGLTAALLSLAGWMIDQRGDRGNRTFSSDGVSQSKEDLRGGVPLSIWSEFAAFVRMG